MDLIDKIKQIAAKLPDQREHLVTEEATKNALVMPFINALGYNVFDPTEVVPEFTADVGTKRGEKVDYVLMRDGAPSVLIECKPAGQSLDDSHMSQLYRYFSVTPARFGVLTNGIAYRFYSDLEEPNKMDSRPFLEFAIDDVSDKTVEEIKKFTKSSFDLEEIISTASDLKYTRGICRALGEEWTNPSEQFVRLLAGRVYPGRMTQQTRAQFTSIVRRAFHDFVNQRINERLQSAIDRSDEASPAEADEEELGVATSDVVTTDQEMEGFHIVRAIVAAEADVDRVFMRDTQSYCGILLDDNNRKPICRLDFDGKKKFLVTFDEKKQATRHAISSPSEVYRFREEILVAVRAYK